MKSDIAIGTQIIGPAINPKNNKQVTAFDRVSEWPKPMYVLKQTAGIIFGNIYENAINIEVSIPPFFKA